MKLIWSLLARNRVAEIAEYIARDSPTAAERWVDSIFAAVERLRNFPESGRIVPEIEKREVREIIFANYRILYRLDKSTVRILTVRHGKQILPLEELAGK